MSTWSLVRFCSNRFRVSASFRLFSMAQNSADSSTRDLEEMRRFAELGKTWWQPAGPFKLLHSLNGIRVPWIRDAVSFIAEVGCGGGLLSERLATLGAKVYGADTDLESVQVAKEHSKLNSKVAERLQYAVADIDTFSQVFEVAQFDAFVASEVLEHVGNREHFVQKSVELVKPGGLLFYTTMNKTQLARFLAVYVAENVLGLVPKGVHDWEKFTPPEDLKSMLERHNCAVKMIHGFLYNPLTNQWFWTAYTGIHYALCAVKG
ncbi:Methyltransf 23 domain containing protein [Trichuris trichiura]|uniref:Ubiquinone biosynthesis O-methyltransferase, mitochondrial n=1 Tax=Trichuris trichiura TaxID=36087 RepID=A0A077ZDA3_TRITR|nr:Methyltransf 23 domain containing protein [Trichuris trichiura]